MTARQAESDGCGHPAEWPAAIDAAFRDHHRAVLRAAFRIVGNAADAEDVLQAVFMNVLKRARGQSHQPIDLGEQPRPYLARAAINAALDLLRKRTRVVDAAAAPEPASDAAGSEADVWRSELRRRLRVALSRLAPRAAEMVALRYFEGYSNVEIAALLNTSASAVAVTLHRARQRLETELEDFEHERG